MKLHGFVFLSAVTIFTTNSTMAADPVEIGYDMVSSNSLNLIEHTNNFENAFSSAGDGFQKYQRGVSPTIPFSVLDDSLSIFTSDSLGIIDETNIDAFFGVTDTINADNSGPVIASWKFDINGETNLAVSIDMGAMGDFESSDYFIWTASIDGGAEQVVFPTLTDEAGSNTYTLSGGTSYTLNDPLSIDGVLLSNSLATFIAPITGTGTTLTLKLEASTDGGSEAYAIQNIRILSGYTEEPNEPVLTRIHMVQGENDVSPLADQRVTIEGIVVGDFQNNSMADNGDLGGFYLQEEDAHVDSNPATSEGIFIYDRVYKDVGIGDKVQVTGVVSEYFGLTEITAEAVEIISNSEPLPSASDLSLPVADIADFEAFEGMRVRIKQPLVISEYYNFDRYGEIVLAKPLHGETRPMTPTAVEMPGSPAYFDRAEANRLSRITLDDGRTSQNPDPAIHPNGSVFTLLNRFRGGDLVQNIEGVLDYRFSLYRVQPIIGAEYIANNPRYEVPPQVGGRLKIAAFNVLNYFTTLDEGTNLCGPDLSLECRGADNEEEFTRQRNKIISAIAAIDADILGLVELENNAGEAINDLVSGLNDLVGAGTYASLDTGTIGSDAIKVGFIYKPAVVETVGNYAILDSSVDPRFIDEKNRPALAQTFAEVASDALLTVAVNHFKSKGSDCDDLGDPDLGDGQGNCNGVRTAAAEALIDWLASDPTGRGDGDVLIIGDLNAYDKEDPISTMTAAGYQDLLFEYQGEFAYTYVFDGQFGYLDYAMANRALSSQVVSAAVWHINADEPDILDYDTTFKKDAQDALYEPDPFRSSDHDPVIIGLDLNRPPVCDEATVSTELLWPANHKMMPVTVHGVVDPEGDTVTIFIKDVKQDEPLTGPGDNFAPDAILGGGNKVYLRAERAGGNDANGRVYHVSFMATAQGGKCMGEVVVGVPLNQGGGDFPVDDGANYLSY